nr:hypothetical protein [Barrientosiimonas endolithica]
MGIAERTGSGDERVTDQAAPVSQLHRERRPVGGDVDDAGIGPDLDAEPVGVSAQVLDDLVAARVAVRVAGERVPGEGTEPAWGEQAQAVVVARPGPDRLVTGLQDDRFPAPDASGAGCGEAGLPAADDQQAAPAHLVVLAPIWTSCGAGAQHESEAA